ncbi:MAG: formylglycine-generating enzyme family protein [Methyloligellaceae bacterium]
MDRIKFIQITILSIFTSLAFLKTGQAEDIKFVHGYQFQDCKDCPKMVVVKGGSFLMGSPPEEKGHEKFEVPQHEVNVGSFAVGQFEVTYEEWSACVKGGGCDGYNPRVRNKGKHPVTRVSWNDAQSYVKWLKSKTGKNYRLLSEAEWEYAARAGTATPYYFGEDKNKICDYANGADKRSIISFIKLICGDGSKYTAVVGSYKPNAFSLYDVYGNVREWVEDEWHPNYDRAPTDGTAWVKKKKSLTADHVLRGGSWTSSPYSMRSAARVYKGADFRSFTIGFRVARDLPKDIGKTAE